MIDLSDLVDADFSEEAAAETLKSISIPPCPGIVVELLQELGREDVDFVRLSRLITGDVGLAAAVLKTANSPFFGLRRKVPSVQQAVAVLGLRNLLKIVYGVVLRQSLGGKDAPPMERFWERSNYNAVVCSYLANCVPSISADDAYTFGLFHDAGIAVLMQKFPDYKQTLMLANAAPSAATAVEDERHHTNHVIVGTLLGRHWYLPDPVVRAIRYHHEYMSLAAPRERTTPEVRLLVDIRLLSEHIVAHFLGYPDDPEWEYAKGAALGRLGWVEDDVDDLARDLGPGLDEIRAYRS